MIGNRVLAKIGNDSAKDDGLVSVTADVCQLADFVLRRVYLHHFFANVFRLDIFNANEPAAYQMLMFLR